MFRAWDKKRRITVIISLVVFSSIIFLHVALYLPGKLSKSEAINANILLVEGWLPTYALRMALDEFNNNGYDQVVTTGIKSTSDYFNIFTNGSLIFNLSGIEFTDDEVSDHRIEIKAYSSLRGDNSAHFNVLINDSVAGDFYADKKKRDYLVEWKGRLSVIDSVSIKFLNDRVGYFGDRNLFVKEIIIDNKLYVPYQLNSTYKYSDSNHTVVINNDYTSYAQLAFNNLLSMGIDSSLIIKIPGKKVYINRTLSSALAFNDWLKISDIQVEGINIITLGNHAKRSYMTYNKILGKKYEIGIISLPDFRANYSRKYNILNALRETVGIVYYWFILLPY